MTWRRARGGVSLLPYAPEPWRDAGLCATTTDPDRWYSESAAVVAHARTICAACPAREPCADYGIENQESWGIWGGLTPNERRKAWSYRYGETG